MKFFKEGQMPKTPLKIGKLRKILIMATFILDIKIIECNTIFKNLMMCLVNVRLKLHYLKSYLYYKLYVCL